VTGAPGAPSGLANAEIAYNEVDHILYYGEGTGGGGGTASIVAAIGGQGLAYTSLPAMDGTAFAGGASLWSRGDHVHPTDTTRAAASSVPGPSVTPPAMDGTQTIGVLATYAHGDHIHPTDTSRYAASNPSGYQTAAQVVAVRLDQFAAPTAPVNWNNQPLQNLAEPSNNSDAATKHYVDGASQGLASKAAVQAATTVNIALSGLQSIDGYPTGAGDRILVKDQTTQANNGIYVASATGWNRATDMATWAQVPNAYVFVSQGTVNQNSSWVCTSTLTGGTIGVTAVTWVQFSQAAVATAGAGLSKVGNRFDVIGTAGRIAVGAAVDIDTNYVGQISIVTLGTVGTGTWNATTIAMARGGTGATSIPTGYVTSNGSVLSSVASIPNSGISGLGTMATQDATNVAIVGGSINNVTFDCGVF
jgi:hypothetical protein